MALQEAVKWLEWPPQDPALQPLDPHNSSKLQEDCTNHMLATEDGAQLGDANVATRLVGEKGINAPFKRVHADSTHALMAVADGWAIISCVQPRVKPAVAQVLGACGLSQSWHRWAITDCTVQHLRGTKTAWQSHCLKRGSPDRHTAAPEKTPKDTCVWEQKAQLMPTLHTLQPTPPPHRCNPHQWGHPHR